MLKGTDRVRLLPVQQITWIEAAGMYVRLHLRDGSVHLHRSLLAGLPTQVGRKDDKGVYLGPRERRFQVFPGSALSKAPPNGAS